MKMLIVGEKAARTTRDMSNKLESVIQIQTVNICLGSPPPPVPHHHLFIPYRLLLVLLPSIPSQSPCY